MKVPPKQAGLSHFREETEMLKSIYGQVSFHIGNKSMPVRKNMDGQVNYILKISLFLLPSLQNCFSATVPLNLIMYRYSTLRNKGAKMYQLS